MQVSGKGGDRGEITTLEFDGALGLVALKRVDAMAEVVTPQSATSEDLAAGHVSQFLANYAEAFGLAESDIARFERVGRCTTSNGSRSTPRREREAVAAKQFANRTFRAAKVSGTAIAKLKRRVVRATGSVSAGIRVGQ